MTFPITQPVMAGGFEGATVAQPLASCTVIIPSYNSAKFIDVALVSLVRQTRRPDQVVIVDAGSDDGTRELVDSFRDHLKIDFLTAPRTSMGVARNIGIRAANCDAICFLDTDDIFLRNHVERACAILSVNLNIDAVHGYPVQWNSFTDRLETSYDWLHEIDHDLEIFESSLINLSTLTVRRSFLTQNGLKFSEGLQGRYCEDWDFCLRLIAAGMRISYLQEPMSVVTERAGSHTRKSIFWKMRFCLLRSMIQHRDLVLDRHHDEQARLRIDAAIDMQAFKATITLLAAGRSRIASRLARRLQKPKYRATAELLVMVARIVPGFHRLARWALQRMGGYGGWRSRNATTIQSEPALDHLRSRLTVQVYRKLLK